jgi:replicative DNA helicase
MTGQEAKDYIRSHPEEYFTRARKSGYVCPLCRNGEGPSGTGLEEIPNSQGYFKCFKCGESGDVFGFIGKEYNTANFKETLEIAYNLYGLIVDDKTYKTIIKKETKQETKIVSNETENQEQDYSKYYEKAHENLNKPEVQDYLTKRRISKETADKFNLGYNEKWASPKAVSEGKYVTPSPRLIIPTSSASYVARDIRETLTPVEKQYAKMKEGKSRLFNSGVLAKAADTPVFIVEGEIDAMSISEVGANAVGLGSTSNIATLMSELEQGGEVSKTRTYILYMDNDDAGTKASETLQKEFKNKGYVSNNIYKLIEGSPNPDETSRVFLILSSARFS